MLKVPLLVIGLICAPVAAQDTTVYSYDALGRLVNSNVTAGPESGRQYATCYDKAGNRVRHDVVSGAPSACPAGVAATQNPLPQQQAVLARRDGSTPR